MIEIVIQIYHLFSVHVHLQLRVYYFLQSYEIYSFRILFFSLVEHLLAMNPVSLYELFNLFDGLSTQLIKYSCIQASFGICNFLEPSPYFPFCQIWPEYEFNFINKNNFVDLSRLFNLLCNLIPIIHDLAYEFVPVDDPILLGTVAHCPPNAALHVFTLGQLVQVCYNIVNWIVIPVGYLIFCLYYVLLSYR